MDPIMTQVSQEGFPTLDSVSPKQMEQLTLFSLQDIAITESSSITDLQQSLKTARQMVTDAYKNSPEYKTREESFSEAKRGLEEAKEKVARNPDIMALETKLKNIRNEIKEKKDIVSSYAIEVFRQTGQSKFTKDGDTFEIKTVAKLTKCTE